MVLAFLQTRAISSKYRNSSHSFVLMLPNENDLVPFFSAIDTVLSLHFSSNTSIPRIHEVCAKATALTNKRVTTETIEKILGCDPTLYKVVSYGNGYDYGLAVPNGISLTKFGSLLPSRKRAFEESLRCKLKVDPADISSLAVPESVNSPVRKSASLSPIKSPTKVVKPRRNDLRNDRSKFAFQERDSGASTKATGLSLLERIKLKEQLKNAGEVTTPQSKYERHIVSKLPEVYDVLYEMSTSSSPVTLFKSFPIAKVISVVRDSLLYAIAAEDVRDVLLEMERKLGKTKMEVLRRGDVCAVKLYPLNRDLDLALLINN